VTERGRRAFLAAATGALAATAGCSRLPFVGDGGDGGVDYDAERLQAVADPTAVTVSASAYPGPIPDDRATRHYERGRELLDGVPRDPAVPNEVVAARLARDRERAAERFADPPDGVSTLDDLDGWRYDRANAAEVRGAYEAATGDADPESLRERRAAVRDSLHAFRGDWAYRARSPLEAVLVHRRLELTVTRAGDAVVADGPFPADPKRAVSAVGSLAAAVEAARADAGDAAALRAAYREPSMPAHRSAVETAAVRLSAAVRATEARVYEYLDPAAGPENFQRNVADTPAEPLFRRAKSGARTAVDSAESALDRGEHARAVTAAGRALVSLVAFEAVVAAIRDGEYGMPASADAVVASREAAVDAVASAESVEPRPLADVLAVRARSMLRNGDVDLAGHPEYDRGDEPTVEDIRNAAGHYALTAHAAAAVEPVARRVTAELRAAAAGT